MTEFTSNYGWPRQTWLRCNFVLAFDGSISIDGQSTRVSGPADKLLLHHLRSISDVVLVGSKTASAENYIGVFPPDGTNRFSNRSDGTAAPALAVVTHSGVINEPQRFLTMTLVPNFLILTSNAPEAVRSATEAVARSNGTMTLLHAPSGLREAISELHARGLTRILCEGGPSLADELLADDLVDEYCLTVSPHIGGDLRNSSRHAVGLPAQFIPKFSTIVDNFVFSRWVRQPRDPEQESTRA